MPNDLSNDNRFTELPQQWQDALKDEPVTDMMGEDEWHEVVFLSSMGFTMQGAVVNRKWIALSPEEVASITGIVKIVHL
jgi:hypothetical protein